ncbi:MAG TPA: ATP phosphoribosyltransferase regulatory subunit [Spirochaetales bacterium]|nr:ATP phosphoribosyltransferase regulatory subunit [Spirochaetales bacterium]
MLTGEIRNLFQIPQGTESLSLKETSTHRRITDALEALFLSWGYFPVQTPVFDFFDIYRPLLKSASLEKVYRLIDRDGDLLMLRSDVTLFLAKQMGLSLKAKDLPVRVSYADSILRHQDREDISHNEFFQVGVELIGKDGLHGDLEILMLLISTLELLELSEAVIHVGSRALFRCCFDRVLETGDLEELEKIIMSRNWRKFTEFLHGVDIEAPEIALYKKIFSFIGSDMEFRELRSAISAYGLLPAEALGPLDYLEELLASIKSMKPAACMRADLSEIGGQPYYTGIVFRGYLPGLDSAAAFGGRYNNLLGFFGFNAPSVGFSILLRKIESRIGGLERFSLKEEIVKVKDNNFIEAYTKAEALRKKGKIVIL